MFVNGNNDQMRIVDEMKIAETGFESAPQAVMQLYLVFKKINDDSANFWTGRGSFSIQPNKLNFLDWIVFEFLIVLVDLFLQHNGDETTMCFYLTVVFWSIAIKSVE